MKKENNAEASKNNSWGEDPQQNKICELFDRWGRLNKKDRITHNLWLIGFVCDHGRTATLEEQDKALAKLADLEPLGFIVND